IPCGLRGFTHTSFKGVLYGTFRYVTGRWFEGVYMVIWCSLSPLSNIDYNRDIYEAGFQSLAKVNDVILNGNLLWPNEWQLKSPMVFSMPVPLLNVHANDSLFWRDLNNVEVDFLVAVVWDSIRPHSTSFSWYKLVWYPQSIPRHAILLYLAIKQKLKTRDSVKQWDVGSNTELNVLRYPLYNMQPYSHDHLFFECIFSTQVLAASCYFIWQERNNRFKKTENVQRFLRLWKIPNSLIIPHL
nr:hypothetical protein [Tanacetum cinerariifolium]